VQAQCLWPEQELYELVRPVVLHRQTLKDRAKETEVSPKTLSRHVDRFVQLGLPGLVASAQREDDARLLPQAIRDFLLERKAEYAALTSFELATLASVRFDRTVSYRTVERTLQRYPLPSGVARRYSRFADCPDPEERRLTIIRLHAEGWTVKRMATYLGTSRQTVHLTVQRWIAEGTRGLADKSHARTQPRKATLPVTAQVRHLQQNPNVGEFRIHAALKQLGLDVSPRTCGRIMAHNRRLYAIPSATRPHTERPAKPMPFAAHRPHEFWSVDIRYVERHQVATLPGPIYVITILDNYSRSIVASAPSPTQNLEAFLLVLFTAIHVHGAPDALVSDGGSVFYANAALAIYEQLGIRKERIEPRQPWQNYVETHFNILRRMADYAFALATSWEEVCAIHARFVADYNWQEHYAHRHREDGRTSPREVLGPIHGRFVDVPTLSQLFELLHGTRRIDRVGYIRYHHWRLYGDEGLVGEQAAVWLRKETLTLTFQDNPVAQYTVARSADNREITQLTEVHPFPPHPSPQPRLFDEATMSQITWHKVLRLPSYRRHRHSTQFGFAVGLLDQPLLPRRPDREPSQAPLCVCAQRCRSDTTFVCAASCTPPRSAHTKSCTYSPAATRRAPDGVPAATSRATRSPSRRPRDPASGRLPPGCVRARRWCSEPTGHRHAPASARRGPHD